jgi:Zn-dependent M28 family amino/carboxypeptidase
MTTAGSNDERHDVLTTILREGGVPFADEAFSVARGAGRDPRVRGRNVSVALGDGHEEIVLGAHYDSAYLADGTLGPGAIDNAASCIALARVAVMLGSDRAARRIRIVWFDMEEVGQRGSKQFLHSHGTDRIRAMLNFDVTGYGDTILFRLVEKPADPWLHGAFVKTCASESMGSVRCDDLPPSDERSFDEAGIPTLSIASLPREEADQLAQYLPRRFDPQASGCPAPAILRIIHSPSDVAGNVDGPNLVRTVRFIAALARACALAPPSLPDVVATGP